MIARGSRNARHNKMDDFEQTRRLKDDVIKLLGPCLGTQQQTQI